MLPVDAVHPKLDKKYERLVRLAEDKPGILGEHKLLSLYLAVQLDMLKTRDVMFAHDFDGHPGALMTYAIGEMRELVEEIPSLHEKALKFDPQSASSEGGDVLWFLGMRVGLAYLDKSKPLSVKEGEMISGFVQIVNAIATLHPDFKPEEHALDVRRKNELNWPDRVLRASAKASINEMSQIFEFQRMKQLKELRKVLPGRKIPPILHDSIQRAAPKMPPIPDAMRGVHARYKDVVVYAREAAQHYAY